MREGSKTKALREALLRAGTALQEAAKAIEESADYESRIAALEARLALLVEGKKHEPAQTALPRHLHQQLANARGQLLQCRDAAARVGVVVGTMHRLIREGIGPPAHKRPGSNRWHYYSNDIDAWLDSGRVNPPLADGHSPTTGQTR
jgi:helix-turn-helix protein